MEIKKVSLRNFYYNICLWSLILAACFGIFVSLVEIFNSESFNISAGRLSFQLIPTIPGSGGKLLFPLGPLGDISWDVSSRWFPLNIETKFFLNSISGKLPAQEQLFDIPLAFGLRKLPWMLNMGALLVILRMLRRYQQFYKTNKALNEMGRSGVTDTKGQKEQNIGENFRLINGPRGVVRVIALLLAPFIFLGSISSLMFLTLNPQKFQNPNYDGPLERVEKVQEAIQNIINDYPTIAGRVQRTILGLLRLQGQLGISFPELPTPDNTVKFLVVSDIHSNPVGMQIIKDLVQKYQVDAIIDSGDLTAYGFEEELKIFFPLEQDLKELGIPYVITLGNHDSNAVAEELRKISEVIVLENGRGDVVEIEGIKILGDRDPASYKTAVIGLDQAAMSSEKVLRERGKQLLVRYNEEHADIVVTHNSLQTETIASNARKEKKALVRIWGHTHKQYYEVRRSVTSVSAGTSGADGVLGRNFNKPFGFMLLVFNKETRRLISVSFETWRIADQDNKSVLMPDTRKVYFSFIK